jgi:pyroglutamyl-peptidase
MSAPLFLVTGFGAFEDVTENASARIVESLVADPPPGVELSGRVLPVSFTRSADEIDEALRALEPRIPELLFSMGVGAGSALRLERRAGIRFRADRPDIDGRGGDSVRLEGADLVTPLGLEPLAAVLARGGAREVLVSSDAGGYVCERVYRHLLEAGERLGIPALFLHVPRIEVVPVAELVGPVRALLTHLAEPSVLRAQISSARRGRSRAS